MSKKICDECINSTATDIILESINDGVFTIDEAFKIKSFNKAAEKITGFSRHEAIGKPCSEIFRSNLCDANCVLRRTMKEKKSYINLSAVIMHKQKGRISVSMSAAILEDKEGNVIGGVETFRDLTLIDELKKELNSRFQLGDIISRNPVMQNIFRLVPQIANSESTVLIEGETGTGKELLARAIHNSGHRSNRPFVAINCGALPDTLLESELFGYKAGAFTHAVKDKPGHFAMAKYGTILLDEIGDTSSAFQVKLLRVLEEKEYTPLGGLKPVKTYVTVIAATNKNLSSLVEKGLFREDLYYRIDVIRLELPPLRERKEDIPLLVDRFIKRRNRLTNRSIRGVDSDVLHALMMYDFPGNIRELENIIERAFILCREDTIQLTHLSKQIHPHAISRISSMGLCKNCNPNEVIVIEEALKRNNFNRLETARELGIHKSTLFRKMKKLGMTPPKKNKHLDQNPPDQENEIPLDGLLSRG
ncbi:sigma 54-interacting transcriptional regulator [bacterium]|nr:sigma 54-interacting transcriptional regulator [bacterium]